MALVRPDSGRCHGTDNATSTGHDIPATTGRCHGSTDRWRREDDRQSSGAKGAAGVRKNTTRRQDGCGAEGVSFPHPAKVVDHAGDDGHGAWLVIVGDGAGGALAGPQRARYIGARQRLIDFALEFRGDVTRA